MNLAKIEGHPTLVRDLSTKHIVQTDSTVVRKHEARALAIAAQKKRDDEIAGLKADVTEIKNMLARLSLLIVTAQIQQPVYNPPVNPFTAPIGSPVWQSWDSANSIPVAFSSTVPLQATGMSIIANTGDTVRYG